VSDTSQGPGWWQASDGKWYPPEQAPGYQAPMGAPMVGPPAATNAFDVGAALTWTWTKFQANLQPLLILGAVVGGMDLIIWFAARFTTSLVASTALSLGAGIITTVLTMLVIRAGLAIARGETLDSGTMFKIEGNVGAYVIAAILFGVLQILGCLVFCVGFFFVWLVFGLWPFFIIDQGAGPTDAFTRSKDATMGPGLGTTFVPMLVFMVLMLIGGRLFGLISVFTIPFGALYGAYVYRTLTGQGVAP